MNSLKSIEEEFFLVCHATEEELCEFERAGHWTPCILLPEFLTFREFWIFSLCANRLVYRVEISGWEVVMISSSNWVYQPIIMDVEPVLEETFTVRLGLVADIAEITTGDLDSQPCLHCCEFRMLPNWILDEPGSDKAAGAIIGIHQMTYLAYRREPWWEDCITGLAEMECKGTDLLKKLNAGQLEMISLPDYDVEPVDGQRIANKHAVEVPPRAEDEEPEAEYVI